MRKKVFSFQNDTTTGILHNMFKSPDYWTLFTYQATGRDNQYPERFAFVYDSDNYWIGSVSSVPNNLTFCFKFFSVLATGYQLKTSNYEESTSARAKNWGFSGSNDQTTWYNYQTVDHLLGPGGKHYEDWTYDIPLRCFKLTTLHGNYIYANRFDVVEIDVFGYVVPDIHTNPQNNSRFAFLLFLYHLLNIYHTC